MPKFADRVRFNWGFHDAAFDVARDREPLWASTGHFDQAYLAGYCAGKEAAKSGEKTESSAKAWAEHKERGCK